MIKTNKGECIKTYIGNKYCGMYIGKDIIAYGSLLTSFAIKILIENFPNKINEILNYVNEHTELIPFINEDPMLVCSLGIEGMPIRWLVGTGTQYFMTSFKSSANDMIKTMVMPTNVGSNQAPYGARNVAGTGGPSSYNNWFLGSQLRIDWAASAGDTYAPNLTLQNNKIYLIEEKKGYCKVNGEVKFNQLVQSENLEYPFYIFAINNQGSVGFIATMKFAWMYKNYIPILLPIKRSNTMELIDLETGTLAIRVGTFAESYTLPDGAPWTPRTIVL